jgi:hypothetical protein
LVAVGQYQVSNVGSNTAIAQKMLTQALFGFNAFVRSRSRPQGLKSTGFHVVTK